MPAAAPRYGLAGELISGGADIQVGGGYYFDAIYIAMIAQFGSIFSGYFWLVLLAVWTAPHTPPPLP